MAVEFRCEKCGKLLKLDVEPGKTATCPHCNKKIVVPEALASLPQPQVAPDQPRAGLPAEQEQEEHRETDAVMAIMARVMPWAISVFFHVGVALIVMFIAIMTPPKEKETPTTRSAPTKPPEPERRLAKQQMTQKVGSQYVSQLDSTQNQKQTDSRGLALEETAVVDYSPTQGDAPTMISRLGQGGSGPGGTLARYDRENRIGGTRFWGTLARADDVIYLIDRSASMNLEGAFDRLKIELARSVAGLDDRQRFNVIFFGGGKSEPDMLDGQGLVLGTMENKVQVEEFLRDIVPVGGTLVLSALERAFAMLEKGNPQTDKVIWLLSDGAFEGTIGGTNEYTDKAGRKLTGNDAVLAWLNDRNLRIQAKDEKGNPVTRRKVQIYTFLYRGDAAQDIKVMETIAAQHDGKFTRVTKND